MDDVRAHAQRFCSVQWMPLHAVWLVIAVDSSHPKKVFAVCTLRSPGHLLCIYVANTSLRF